jgi:two-component system response regulator ResD
MNGLKVLVVDDDPNVKEIIRLYFEKQLIQFVEASNGREAMAAVERDMPDIVVLDVMMPVMDGYETCRELNKMYDIPIIMLTAKGDEFDRVLGLELGADDYVTKPFSPRELVARIKAITRRLNGRKSTDDEDAQRNIIDCEPVMIRIDRREVTVDGETVPLRPKEFDLLAHLARSPGLVFSREQLLEQVWGYDFLGDIRTVDVHVKRLRSKLGETGGACIHTVWGIGYKFEAQR